jgi:probable F420-dependent oxidoreductase
MRTGLMLAIDTDLGRVADVAAAAERGGWDHLACGEHVFFHGPTPNALVTLAAASGATSRIRLLSALTILPLYPVALVAKMIATIDGLSRGRFDLGVGVGGEYPAEFEACGVPVAERGPRADEALDLLRVLLAGETVDVEGRWTTIRGERLQPAAVQRPGPPVWIGGRRPAAARRAGRSGDVWMPYLVTPEQLRTTLAEGRAAAVGAGRDPAGLRGAVHCWAAVDADGDRARRHVTAAVSRLYAQDMAPFADRYLLAGTPDEIIERLARYAAMGAETVVLAPVGPAAEVAAMTTLLEREVLPALVDLPVVA